MTEGPSGGLEDGRAEGVVEGERPTCYVALSDMQRSASDAPRTPPKS